MPTLAADYNGNDEFGPSAELLELIDNGRPEFFKDGLCRDYGDRVTLRRQAAQGSQKYRKTTVLLTLC